MSYRLDIARQFRHGHAMSYPPGLRHGVVSPFWACGGLPDVPPLGARRHHELIVRGLSLGAAEGANGLLVHLKRFVHRSHHP